MDALFMYAAAALAAADAAEASGGNLAINISVGTTLCTYILPAVGSRGPTALFMYAAAALAAADAAEASGGELMSSGR
jgi:hypothetical protein